MAMDIGPLMTESELQRKQQIRDRFVQENRAQRRAQLGRKIFSAIRVFFLFLLGAVIVTFLVSHRNEIGSMAAQKINHVVTTVQSKSTSDPLRQTALNYEHEVEEVAK